MSCDLALGPHFLRPVRSDGASDGAQFQRLDEIHPMKISEIGGATLWGTPSPEDDFADRDFTILMPPIKN